MTSGRSLFAIVNGRCVEDPKSRASDLTSKSLLGLGIASNRDIIGIALANLIVSKMLKLLQNFGFSSNVLLHLTRVKSNAETLLETCFEAYTWADAHFPT